MRELFSAADAIEPLHQHAFRRELLIGFRRTGVTMNECDANYQRSNPCKITRAME